MACIKGGSKFANDKCFPTFSYGWHHGPVFGIIKRLATAVGREGLDSLEVALYIRFMYQQVGHKTTLEDKIC